MADNETKDIKKSRPMQGTGKVQENRVFIGSRVEPTSTSPGETPAPTRPKKK